MDDREQYAICIKRDGIAYAARLMDLLRPWIESGREVDIVDISADRSGGSIKAVVDGIIVMAEVYGL